ncbi:MAG: GNAT family N-acetyltransferase [Bacilli bacterium]|nr:GNAT family N-acetyltransferase [Bacilli bacterium]
MEYIVRKGEFKDLLGIMSVIDDAKELFRLNGSTQWQDTDGYPNANTFIKDLEENEVLVCVDDEKIIGVVVVSYKEEECYKTITQGKWLNDNHYAVIHRLAVKKEYYHQGVARLLLDKVEYLVIERNIYDIKADTHEKNIAMQHLLETSDYSYTGVVYLLRPDVLEKKRLAYHKIIGRKKHMKKAILLIHGFLSDMTDFDNLVPFLEERYDYVCKIVLPGHGPENNYDYDKFNKEDTFKHLTDTFDDLHRRYKEIDVLGFSMGGALASCLSSFRNFNKLILLAPANKYFNPKALVSTTEFSARNFSSLEKAIVKKSAPEQEAYKNLLKAVSSDSSLGLSFVLRKYLRSYIWKAYNEFKDIVLNCNKDLTEIKNPTLICWGTIDQLVPRKSVEYLYSICTNPNKNLKIYEGITHLMLMSKNSEPIIKDILDFLDN